METGYRKVWLSRNGTKPKFLACNVYNPPPLHTRECTASQIEDSLRKSWVLDWLLHAWHCNQAKKAKTWKVVKRDDQGLVLQHEATLGSILLCGCESCSVTQRYTHTNDEKGPQCTLDSHTTNDQLYSKLPSRCDKIVSWRLQLVRHCHRHPELRMQMLVLWDPKHGHEGKDRPITSFVDTVNYVRELSLLMEDRDVWRNSVNSKLRSTKW